MTQTHRVVTGGRVWNGTAFAPATLVLEGARIARIVPAGEPLPLSPETRQHDAAGAAIFPGFVDAHAHPLIGGTEFAGAPVRAAGSVDEALEIVAAFADAHPELPWIVGEGFDLSIAEGGLFLASDLDRVVPDRPVALRSSDIHTMWANSRALAAAGIDAATPDPEDGVIERDASGAPSGTLREWGAFMPLYRALPRRTPEETAEALLRGLRVLSAEGVTTAQDAWVELEDLDGYLLAARRGLPLRLNLAFRATPEGWREQLAHFAEARAVIEELRVPDLTARTVKFFADGIIEGGTAHVSEAYHGTSCCGLPAWDPETLAEAAAAFDRLGFQLHIHAIGDAGLTSAVDAILRADEENGARDRRPVIAHAQLVEAADLARLREAEITVAIQPYWAKLDSVVRRLTNGRLRGEREQRQYPFETMRRAGVRLASSSDYPITTPSPLHALAVGMSRDERGDLAASWLPAERLSFDDALRAATVDAAYTQFADGVRGRLAAGFDADFVLVAGVSDQPTPAELLSARVVATWRGGTPETASQSGIPETASQRGIPEPTTPPAHPVPPALLPQPATLPQH